MYIKSIELKDYRNYKDLCVEFSDKVNIFIGNNAQGKTNLLESIYMNAMGRSFKSVKEKDLIRFGQDFCRIHSFVETKDQEEETEIVIAKDGRKSIKVNGVKIRKTSELLERIYVIIFSPDDLKIVKEDPEKRRRFIDRELCLIRPGYLHDISEYKKALLQRNTLLKERYVDPVMIDVWDQTLAASGVRVLQARKEFVQKIDRIARNIHGRISGGKESLHLQYETNLDLPDDKDEAVQKYLEILKEQMETDLRNRNTGKGPHRDDLRIEAEGIDLRTFGSQGQQRTAALSLKLSEIKIIEEETGEKPILLLDDVLSELDHERQSYLIHSLGENQLFITTTDIAGKVAKNMPQSKVYKIENGEIQIEI